MSSLFEDSYEQAISDANRNLVSRPPAGFGESFLQELGLFWRENLSISRPLALGEAQRERSQRIRDVAGDEAFIKAITLSGDPKTQSMIDTLAVEHPGEIQTDAELMAGIKTRNKTLREEHDEALRNQTTGGKIGGFLGVMAGAVSDPIILGTLPLGASWATGIAKTALIEAGIAAGVESFIQPAVIRYKQELESPYDLGDAVINIAGAGVGAGVLTAGVKATARAIGRLGRAAGEVTPRRVAGYDDMVDALEKLPNPTTEQRDALRVLREYADTLRQSPFERAHPTLDELHLDAMARASDDLANGRPVDVSQFIEQPRAARPSTSAVDDLDIDVEESLGTIANRKQVSDLLAQEDVVIRVEVPGGTPDARGELPTMERSAREVLKELDDDAKAASIVKNCLLGG